MFNCSNQSFVRKKRTISNGESNAGHILVDNSARTQVKVADLAVALFAPRKANSNTGSLQIGHREASFYVVKSRLDRFPNRVGRGFRASAETVENHEQNWFLKHNYIIQHET